MEWSMKRSVICNKINKIKFYINNLPGLPRKTEEYNTRLEGSLARVSGGDDHSLRHHRPAKKCKKKINYYDY